MEKINLGIIGAGRMGAFTSNSVKKFSPAIWMPLSHLEAAQQNNKFNIVGICDKSNSALIKVKKN